VAKTGDKGRVLVVDDKESMREMLSEVFCNEGLSVLTASTGEEAIDRVGSEAFDVIVTDFKMPGKNGLDVLRSVKELSPETEVILMTAYGTIETAVEAMRLGAFDFVSKPFELAEMELKVRKCLELRGARKDGAIESWMPAFARNMVGASAYTKQLLTMVDKIGPSNSSVLITGETGTGKELVARAIHDASARRNKTFLTLNCAALASGVLESELFGHEKGAFTGADQRRQGRFERAHGGTLFLDEVGEIDPGIQVKLLRVLQEGEFERVGGMETVKVDVRIVAATNRDLREAIEAGLFREDFYYRLNVFSLKVEPLRNRSDDIPGLIDHFLHKFSEETGKDVREVSDDVMDVFMRYSWPGNVRELQNVLERAVVLAEGNTIRRSDIPPELIANQNLGEKAPKPAAPTADGGGSLIEQTDQLEAELIRGALERFHWNKTKAAEHLNIKRTTLQYKIKKYELE